MTGTESKDEGDHSYFRAIEELFIRLRGTPLLLSPADWQVARGWRQQGIPLNLVCQTLEELFARREEEGKKRSVRSLKYFDRAVGEAWQRQCELGAPAVRPSTEPIDVPSRLGALVEALPAAIPRRDRYKDKILQLVGNVDEVETALSLLDTELLEDVRNSLNPETEADIAADLEKSLERLTPRIAQEELAETRQQLYQQALRRRIGLPVLSLFAPETQPDHE